MSVSNQENKINYISSGLADYEIPFFFAEDSDVKVYVDDILRESGYTVAGAGDEDGGTLSFTSGTPAAAAVVTILRDVPLTQESSFSEGGPMPASTIELMFDKLTYMAQQLSEKVSRAIKLPLSSTGLDPQITGTVVPGALIEVDEAGTGLKMGQSVAAYTAQLDAIKGDALAAQAAAEAAQTAAGGSATSASTSASDALASKNLAADWAAKTSSNVDGVSFSSKEYAQGTQANTGGSAKDWAQKTSSAVTGSLYSAKEWAIGILTRGLSGGGSAKDWAIYTGGTVDDTGYSAKYHAEAAAASLATVNGRLDALEAAKTTNYIVGNATTDGSWRYRQDSTDLVKETRIAGVWTEKERVTQAN